MTANHAELCERLRDQAAFDQKQWGGRGGDYVSISTEAADMLEQQAARIQQQALEYVSLQAQCDEHLTRVSRLEILLDSERATNKALSDENAVLADRQPQELLARVAELEKERDALRLCVKDALEQCVFDMATDEDPLADRMRAAIQAEKEKRS